MIDELQLDSFIPTITARSQLTLLQRVPEKQEPEKEKTSQEAKAHETRENIQKRVLRSITRLNPHQTEKSKSVLKKLHSSSDVSINDEDLIEIDNIPAAIDAESMLMGFSIPKRCISSKDDFAIVSFSGQSFLGVQKLGWVETAMRCVVLWVHGVLKLASPKIDDCCSIIFLEAVSVIWDRSRETARTGLWLGGAGELLRVEVNLVTLSVTGKLRQLMFMSFLQEIQS